MLNIKGFLKKYHKIEIEILLAEVLKKPKEFLFMNPEYQLSSYQVKSLSSLLKRRLMGEPVAYILGYKDFYGFRFKVNKNVLIPRPETEQIVHQVCQVCKVNKAKQLQILDIGTGSGCIIISIAKQFENLKSPILNLQYIASDISVKALAVAKQNAKIHKVKVKFVKSDLLKNIKFVPDIIVANLPYVPKKIYDLRFKDLRWEPKGALVDRVKDFDIYERLLKQISALPHLPKVLFLEIDPKTKKYVINYVIKYLPKAKIKFYKDFNNLWRFAEITF